MKHICLYLILLGGLLGFVCLAFAATFDFSGWIPGASTTITVSTVAVGITTCGSAPVDGPALIQVLSNGIWFRVDSATATPASTDFIAVASDLIVVPKTGLFRAIRSGSDAKLKVQCLGK